MIWKTEMIEYQKELGSASLDSGRGSRVLIYVRGMPGLVTQRDDPDLLPPYLCITSAYPDVWPLL